MKNWELKINSSQLADTGDYSVFAEITNGDVSIYSDDFEDDESLNKIVDVLNESGCSFFIDDLKNENYMLRKYIEELQLQLNKLKNELLTTKK